MYLQKPATRWLEGEGVVNKHLFTHTKSQFITKTCTAPDSNVKKSMSLFIPLSSLSVLNET